MDKTDKTIVVIGLIIVLAGIGLVLFNVDIIEQGESMNLGDSCKALVLGWVLSCIGTCFVCLALGEQSGKNNALGQPVETPPVGIYHVNCAHNTAEYSNLLVQMMNVPAERYPLTSDELFQHWLRIAEGRSEASSAILHVRLPLSVLPENLKTGGFLRVGEARLGVDGKTQKTFRFISASDKSQSTQPGGWS